MKINKSLEAPPELAEVLGMTSNEFLDKYCKHGVVLLAQEFRAGDKAYSMSTVTVTKNTFQGTCVEICFNEMCKNGFRNKKGNRIKVELGE